ncbi:MAG: discoidin domain-containing protein, partial [bacterium]
SFEISAEELYYFDENTNAFAVHPGTFTVTTGGSSDNLPLSGSFTVLAAPEKPDLVVSHVRWVPRYPTGQDSVIFICQVLNQGTGPSPSGVIHNVAFRINGQLYSRSADFTQSIPAGGAALLAANLGVSGNNRWPAQLGTHVVEAWVDDQNSIPECIEDNNRLADTLEVIPVPPENLAYRKPVIVSSIEGPGLEGDKAVDGFYATRWSSQFSDPQFIAVDLGTSRDIGKVVLTWEAAYGKTYVIQISNDSVNWVPVTAVANGDGGIDILPLTAHARFVRMYGLQRGTEWGYSLYEFEIYGPASTSSLEHNASPDGQVQSIHLENNYPNPFNPKTIISWHLEVSSRVNLTIYNLAGQTIATLVDDRFPAGSHSVEWDASHFSSGVYLYKLETEGFVETRKMILMK